MSTLQRCTEVDCKRPVGDKSTKLVDAPLEYDSVGHENTLQTASKAGPQRIEFEVKKAKKEAEKKCKKLCRDSA